MNKQQALEKIEELKKFVEECDKPKGRRAKKGEQYFFINTFGDIHITEERYFREDNYLYSTKNYFLTRAEAEKQQAKNNALLRVRKYIEDNFGIFEPDWEDENQSKCYICYNTEYEKLGVEERYWSKFETNIGYLKLREHCDQLIKDCKEDLELILK